MNEMDLQNILEWVKTAATVVGVALAAWVVFRIVRYFVKKSAHSAHVNGIRNKVKERLDEGLGSQAISDKEEALAYLRGQERAHRGKGLQLREVFSDEILELEAQVAGPNPAHAPERRAIVASVREKISDALDSRSVNVKKRALDYLRRQERMNPELNLGLERVFREEIFELQGQMDTEQSQSAGEYRDERSFAQPREVAAAPQLLALAASATVTSRLSLDQQKVETEIKAQLVRAHKASQASDAKTIYEVVKIVHELIRPDNILAEKYCEVVVEFEVLALILRKDKVPAASFVKVAGFLLERIEQFPKLMEKYSDDLRARRDQAESETGSGSDSLPPPASGSGSGPRPVVVPATRRAQAS
jgi:hypothetical protein